MPCSGTRAPSPTPQSPDVHSQLPNDAHHLHSREPLALAPTAAAQSDPLLLLYYMSQHPKGSHSHVPTATGPTALLQQLQRKCLHPTRTRSLSPTVGVAKGAVLQLHKCQVPRGTPRPSTTATPLGDHQQQHISMLCRTKGSHYLWPTAVPPSDPPVLHSASKVTPVTSILPCPL
jgi:hypothetical protein